RSDWESPPCGRPALATSPGAARSYRAKCAVGDPPAAGHSAIAFRTARRQLPRWPSTRGALGGACALLDRRNDVGQQVLDRHRPDLGAARILAEETRGAVRGEMPGRVERERDAPPQVRVDLRPDFRERLDRLQLLNGLATRLPEPLPERRHRHQRREYLLEVAGMGIDDRQVEGGGAEGFLREVGDHGLPERESLERKHTVGADAELV